MDIEIIENPWQREAEVKRCIEEFGHTSEHSYAYFLARAENDGKCLFLKSPEGFGILAHYAEGPMELVMLSEALAPKENRGELLHSALNAAFKNLKIRKFVVEQTEGSRNTTLEMLRGNGYRALSPRYTLYWPMFDMRRWQGDELIGAEWKKLRNIRNRFQSEHSIEIKDGKNFDKDVLKGIVKDWTERRKILSTGVDRKDSNTTLYQQYIKMIDLSFEGFKHAKVMLVDGVPSAITAGWEIPNSDKGFYSSVGICNYKYEGMFEIANMDDLCYLKARGYKLVDFGGSPMPLLNFKLKFKPNFIYTTHTYAIAPREVSFQQK